MNNQKGISSLIGIVIVVAVALVLVGGIFGYQYLTQPKENNQPQNQNQQTACTEEAKVCPDGSAVGRTGPNCEFAECPVVQDQTAGWRTYTNTKYGYEIKYPKDWVSSISDTGILLVTPEHEEQNKNNQNILPPVFDFSAGHGSNDWFLENAKDLTGKEFTNIKDFFKDAYGNVAEINIDGKNAYATVVSTSKNDYLVYIEMGENTYISLTMPYIGPQPGLDPKNPKITTEAKNIISTFKFTK